MISNCPNAKPSLDHADGWYCVADCGGHCHTQSEPDKAPSTNQISKDSVNGGPQLHPSPLGTDPVKVSHPFADGEVVWLQQVYYGRPIWSPFVIVGGLATTHIEVDGRTVEDSLVINEWFLAHAKAVPELKPGTTINYFGHTRVVYYLDSTRSTLWLMESGDTTALPYHWPNLSDSTNPRPFSHSSGDNTAISSNDDKDLSDSANPRPFKHRWVECGPYSSKGRTYYRYRWGRGAKIEGVRHIPGGALTREVVANRAYQVHQAVHVEQRPHESVVAMIDEWRAQGRKKRSS